MSHPLDIRPLEDFYEVDLVDLASDLDFRTYDANGLRANAQNQEMLLPRVVHVVDAGRGTLVVETGRGNTRVYHGLADNKILEPSPLVIRQILTASTAGDLDAYVMVDDITQTSTFTGWDEDTDDANSAATADTPTMPVAETTDDGFLVAMATPFNLLSYTLSTAGSGGLMTPQYYSGDSTTYDATYTDLPGVEGDKDLLSTTGTVTWTTPSDWNRVSIGSFGSYFWAFFRVATVYTTNPVGTQFQTGSSTNVSSLRVAA